MSSEMTDDSFTDRWFASLPIAILVTLVRLVSLVGAALCLVVFAFSLSGTWISLAFTGIVMYCISSFAMFRIKEVASEIRKRVIPSASKSE